MVVPQSTGQQIPRFSGIRWRCVFQDVILDIYHTVIEFFGQLRVQHVCVELEIHVGNKCTPAGKNLHQALALYEAPEY